LLQIILRLLLAGTLSVLPGGHPTAQPPSQPAFGTATTAVVVDAVVRDRKGNPVTDLQKDDFELFEDGVRQQIADVTIVAPGRTMEHGGGTAHTAAARQAGFCPSRLTRPRVALASGESRSNTSATNVGMLTARRASGVEVPAVLTNAMFNTWEALSRERQGYATTNALLAITSALGMLPGRKTVVFFAEGLAIPDAVLPHFRNVVTTANRANVSVYTIDAGGLRVHSNDAVTGRTVRAAGEAALKLTPDGSSQSNLGVLEANEDALRKDPRTSLTLLAEQTGGFLVENTNDLARAFGRIDADRRFHYLLTYSPKRNDLTGEWRSVTVTVPSRDVTVRARSGYLAVRALGAIPLLAYEGPALAALERTPPPRDIALRAAVHVFPQVSESRLTVLASTQGADLTFARDEKNGTFRAEFTILARIRNAAGEIVRKASQPYRLSGPVAQLAQTQQGEVLFFRQPTLTPGTYSLDVAVHDALAGRAGVHT
jgi:VWFA-related protein